MAKPARFLYGSKKKEKADSGAPAPAPENLTKNSGPPPELDLKSQVDGAQIQEVQVSLASPMFFLISILDRKTYLRAMPGV